MSNRDNNLIVFVLGGIIGAAVGLLYAPKTGKETRENLKKLVGDISDTVSDIAQDAKETGRKIYEQGYEKIKTGKDKISEAFEDGKKVFEQYRDESKDE